MLLVIDSGNTNTVFALFNDTQLVGKWRLSAEPQRTDDEYILALSHLFSLHDVDITQVSDAVIANVVPRHGAALEKLCHHHLGCSPLVVGCDGVKTGISINIDRPAEVGADRIVNAVAAHQQCNSDVIVIDFGTATTFDVISKNGAYEGGIIAPGINLSIKALHRAAAKLPEVAIEKPQSVIGKSTVTAMQSGIYWGYIGLIEGIIRRIKAERQGPVTTLATGGLAPLFFDAIDEIESLEGDLTIYGLRYIFERNTVAI